MTADSFAVRLDPIDRARVDACEHGDVRVLGIFGDRDEETLEERGVPLRPSFAAAPALPEELAPVCLTGRLGCRARCGVLLVAMRLADYARRTERAWTVAWTPARFDAHREAK
jgi:hypothetical protein